MPENAWSTTLIIVEFQWVTPPLLRMRTDLPSASHFVQTERSVLD
jgi:hypothetical protein